MGNEKVLSVEGLHTYYGGSHILKGMTISISKGEICCILGRNGMGKTTTLKSIMGLTYSPQGNIFFGGLNISKMKPWERANLGIGYIPQGRGMFPRLTVYENLAVCKRKLERRDLEEIYELFPKLKERTNQLADKLSGGERQMLACARALVKKPTLILMDEPSEGLSPGIVEQLRKAIKSIQEKGRTILLVEQNVAMSLEVSDRIYLIESGEVKFEGMANELTKEGKLIKKYVGI